MCCARISPSRACSEKFFEPTTIVLRSLTARNQQSRQPEQQKSRSSTSQSHRTGRNRRSSTPSTKSAASASSAAGIAPARINWSFTIASPRKINSPKPPAPTAAAIVAIPIVSTVAIRNSCQHGRKRQRQFHLEEDLPIRHAHSSRRFAHGAIDTRNSRRSVADDWKQRIKCKRRNRQPVGASRQAKVPEAGIRIARDSESFPQYLPRRGSAWKARASA